MQELDKITPLEENFSQWYIDVVTKGNLMSYGLVKGTIIFKPNSFAIWENIQEKFNVELRKMGINNVYMPLLMPYKYIEMEKDHVKGFAPELGMITKIGDQEIEPLVIRPTSEVPFSELMAREVKSYNDLPIMYNQWANVIRYEKKTNPFLRTSEFLWHEGHTVHSSALEARKLSRKMIRIYNRFFEDCLAIPTIIGRKTTKEKFPGAVSTYTVESMMKNGHALQSGTSHYLGQNFAKPFGIKFTSKENKEEFIYQTSFGFSTRILGAIIMSHGDNRGIVIPPMVAKYQIDILELFASKEPSIAKVAQKLKKDLSRRWRVRLENSDKSFGIKAGNSEIEGTPLRIEIGPRDLASGIVKIVRRDTLEKYNCKLEDVKKQVAFLLKEVHNNLLESARKRLMSKIIYCDSYEKLKIEIANSNFVLAPFAGNDSDEVRIKNETQATSRCIPLEYPLESKPKNAKCIITNKPTQRFVIFSIAY